MECGQRRWIASIAMLPKLLTLNGARERIAKQSYIRATGVSIPYFDAGSACSRERGGAPYESRAATTSCLICLIGLRRYCRKPPEYATLLAQPELGLARHSRKVMGHWRDASVKTAISPMGHELTWGNDCVMSAFL
jgi:hypothetical protein